MSDLVRSFIAIEIPESVKNELKNIQDSLNRGGFDIKFVEPSNIHLTLKFLGLVDVATLENIKRALSVLASKYSEFSSHLKGVGVFPDIRRPRVIWVDINKNEDKILEIYGDLESALYDLGFEKVDRPFKTHLTIGRMRSLKNIDKLQTILDGINFNSKEDFKISEISFFKP